MSTDKNEATTVKDGPLTLSEAGAQIKNLYTPPVKEPSKEASHSATEQDEAPAEKVRSKKVTDDQEAETSEVEDVQEIEDVDDEIETSDDDLEDVDTEEGDQDEEEAEDTESEELEADANSEDEYDEEDLIEIPLSNGETEKVTPEELIQGYMRQSDYTQKSQEVANQRKEIEAIQSEISDLPEVRKNYQDEAVKFQQTGALLLKILGEKFIPQAPDASLIESNPTEYVRQKELREEGMQFANAIGVELNKLQAQSAQYLQQEIEKGTQTLMREYPVLKSEEEQKALRTYIKDSFGYSDEQIDLNPDHNLFIMAHKAMKYDKLVKKGKKIKPKNKKPKVLKSKKARADKGSIAQQKRTTAMNQHRQTGSLRSAANAISEGIKAKKSRKRR